MRAKSSLHLTATRSFGADDDALKPSVSATGLISRYQLCLIACLVLTSSCACYTTSTHLSPHLRGIAYFVNQQLFGKSDLNIYSSGNNIDDFISEIATFSEMAQHFQTLMELLDGLDAEAFCTFEAGTRLHLVEISFKNGTQLRLELLTEEIGVVFNQADLRSLLLPLSWMKIILDVGSTEKALNITIQLTYTMHSAGMMRIVSQLKFNPHNAYEPNRNYTALRVIEIILFVGLILTYLDQLNQIRRTLRAGSH